MKSMMKALTKTTSKMTSTKTSTLQKNPSGAMMLGNLALKPVYIADLGDGAFTDSSIKIKPNREGAGLVMKCVDRKRLLAGLAQAGIDAGMVEIKKGKKHWIAVVGVPASQMKALVKA